MSALQAPLTVPQAEPAGRPGRPAPLRAVPNKPRQIAQLPFVLIIAVLLGGGMTGVLVLSTTIQTQSAELIALQTREAELRYQEAALVAQVLDLRSSQNLAERAWAQGMRPNPNPAFIQMPGGQIVGVPDQVNGDELGGIVPPQVVAAAQAAAQAAAAQAAAEAAAAEAAAAEAAVAQAAATAAAHAPGATPDNGGAHPVQPDAAVESAGAVVEGAVAAEATP